MEGEASKDPSEGTTATNQSLEQQDEGVSERNVAVEEAAAVLDAVGGETHLDGFNLLGVIANPRGSVLLSPTSFHGRYNSAPTTPARTAASSSGGTPASSDMLTDTYYSLESTLSQVTEQMEALNSVLEDWSRQILEDPYPTYEDQPPESVLTELPVELRELDLQSLQSYLEASGVAAHSFQQRKLQRHEVEDAVVEETTAGRPPLSSEDSKAPMTTTVPVTATPEHVESEIPSRFFQTDFDLTDPETFRELLILNDDGGEEERIGSGNKEQSESRVDTVGGGMTTDGPVHGWFPLPPQDAFGTFLDKVELALLQQVRSKSGAFFEESLRFAQLQEMIQVLLSQVVTMQTATRHLKQDLFEPMATVPTCDEQRSDLQDLLHVLDGASDMLQCKSSISGFLSAQDDLTAIEQIQYGRRLLSGTAPADGGERGVELRRLHALKTVNEQLNQYELLVVTNLREELVEVFLGWNTSAVSSIYAVNGTGSTPNFKSAQVKVRVREIVGALEKCRALSKARDAYGARLQEVIRMTVRTTVGEFASDAGTTGSRGAPLASGATAMSIERFLDCLDMLFEQLLGLLSSASGVNGFCVEEVFSFQDGDSDNTDSNREDGASNAHSDASASAAQAAPERTGPMSPVVTSAAELCSKSISEVLRLRKEAHSLVTLEEMKRIWDKCMAFTASLEDLSGHRALSLRSTLLAQAKAFVERRHESNMSALVAALDSERWSQCEVSSSRQAALSRLCSGRSIVAPPASLEAEDAKSDSQKKPEAEVEGRSYKVVWSCLLLMEMVIANLAAAAYFPTLASGIVSKESELLRLFNSRTTQLVLGAGAIHSMARLKSINAKHLSLVTQCLGIVSAILPHVRAGLMTQLPQKQHTLLSTLDQIKKEYADHNEKILNKFVTIIGGIVEHGLAPKIRETDFDKRSQIPPGDDGKVACCIFLEGVSTNTRKMHQVLASLLPPDHLQNVFSRIFAYVDQKIPVLFVAAAGEQPVITSSPLRMNSKSPRASTAPFSFPKTADGKRRLLLEVNQMTKNLNGLGGVNPWDFTATTILGKEIEFQLDSSGTQKKEEPSKEPKEEAESEADATPKAPVCATLTTMGTSDDRAIRDSAGNNNLDNADEPDATDAEAVKAIDENGPVATEEVAENGANQEPSKPEPVASAVAEVPETPPTEPVDQGGDES